MSSDSSAKTSAAVDLATTTCRQRIKTASENKTRSPATLAGFFGALTRRKPLDGSTDTSLDRCLNLLDLTTLGVGSTLGLGLYVLAGQLACKKAGPAVILSFAFAAFASALSALCYAEFAGRVPRAGSAYAYSYITVGEFVAFIIGWNLILEYVIGASSVARGFSGYLRFVFANVTSNLGQASSLANIQPDLLEPVMTAHHNFTPASIESNLTKLAAASIGGSSTTKPAANFLDATSDYLVRHFDWVSIVIIVAVTIFILLGVKGSTNVTLAFTAVNMIVVVTVVISSLKSLDIHNWQLTKEELPEGGEYGEGGFLPYGWSGVLAGGATCFFGFIGFDTIASSAEEAKNPKRNVPLAIVLSLFISFLAYMAVAITQTLLWPYYDQESDTILPDIFGRLGMPITYWVVLLGAIAGLASSQLGGMYPLPRILYSMAQDKLIYNSLAHVNQRLRLPVRATIVGAIFIAALACLLDIRDLADMVSIGTLAAYSLVCVSVLIVRYDCRHDSIERPGILSIEQLECAKLSGLQSMKLELNAKSGKEKRMGLLDLLTTWRSDDDPTKREPDDHTARQAKILLSVMLILTVTLDLVAFGLISTSHPSLSKEPSILARIAAQQSYLQPSLVLLCSGSIILFALSAAGLMLSRLPTSRPTHPDMFLVPLVPLIPILSIFVNTFLMLNLSYLTWIRFAIWMSIGLFIYFTYGIWNSVGYLLNASQRQEIE